MLFLDTSALVKRYVEEEGTQIVLRRMQDDLEWVVSAVARTEAEITFCRLGFAPDENQEAWRRLREDWDRCHVAPVDLACWRAPPRSAVGTGFERWTRSISLQSTACRVRS